jgi:hypothetical protein
MVSWKKKDAFKSAYPRPRNSVQRKQSNGDGRTTNNQAESATGAKERERRSYHALINAHARLPISRDEENPFTIEARKIGEQF